MADATPGLADLCQAIEAGDVDQIALRQREFVARNWSLVSILDQLAHAEFSAGQFKAAAEKLRLIEGLVPHISGFFLRRASAELRAGVTSVLEELAGSAERLANDNELFHVVQELVANGRSDLAANLIAECTAREVFSPGILAAAESRVLATMGRIGDAVALLEREMMVNKPHLTAMRCHYLLLEQVLKFAASNRACFRAALLWGEERELRHLVERLLYIFDFQAIENFLRQFTECHPGWTELAESLREQAAAVKSSAGAALAEHGPVDAATPDEIYAALSQLGTSATRVLWGKQALVALLYSQRMTESDVRVVFAELGRGFDSRPRPVRGTISLS